MTGQDHIDLDWIPLGAGASGALVRWSGRIEQAIVAVRSAGHAGDQGQEAEENPEDQREGAEQAVAPLDERAFVGDRAPDRHREEPGRVPEARRAFPVRLRFSEQGKVRFVSHRDAARAFERAFRNPTDTTMWTVMSA